MRGRGRSAGGGGCGRGQRADTPLDASVEAALTCRLLAGCSTAAPTSATCTGVVWKAEIQPRAVAYTCPPATNHLTATPKPHSHVKYDSCLQTTMAVPSKVDPVPLVREWSGCTEEAEAISEPLLQLGAPQLLVIHAITVHCPQLKEPVLDVLKRGLVQQNLAA